MHVLLSRKDRSSFTFFVFSSIWASGGGLCVCVCMLQVLSGERNLGYGHDITPNQSIYRCSGLPGVCLFTINVASNMCSFLHHIWCCCSSAHMLHMFVFHRFVTVDFWHFGSTPLAVMHINHHFASCWYLLKHTMAFFFSCFFFLVWIGTKAPNARINNHWSVNIISNQ